LLQTGDKQLLALEKHVKKLNGLQKKKGNYKYERKKGDKI
jgi:hypothetical protein